MEVVREKLTCVLNEGIIFNMKLSVHMCYVMFTCTSIELLMISLQSSDKYRLSEKFDVEVVSDC